MNNQKKEYRRWYWRNVAKYKQKGLVPPTAKNKTFSTYVPLTDEERKNPKKTYNQRCYQKMKLSPDFARKTSERNKKAYEKRKRENMKHYETSVTHRQLIESGLTITWSRTSAQDRPDDTWSVVCYSDDSRWLIDNGSAERIALLGTVKDGLNTAEVLETSAGSIVALYCGGIQAFASRDEWVDSLPESDKPEAIRLLADN